MQKKVPTNLSSWEKPQKLDAAKINTFTVSNKSFHPVVSEIYEEDNMY